MKVYVKIHWKKSLVDFFYCKATVYKFNERELCYKYYPITFAKFFRAATLKIISKRLPLQVKIKVKINTVTIIKIETST